MDQSLKRVHSEAFSITSGLGVVLRADKWLSALASTPAHAARPIILFVHQYTVMGGSRQLMTGMARHTASLGYEAVTFDLRGAGDSSGSCTFRNKSERNDVLAVIRHLEVSSSRPILLVGSSAGAALAGSVLETSSRVLGGVFVGYTWGWGASLLFGWAFSEVKQSTKPKVFVVGTADEFTSMSQYSSMMKAVGGEKNEMVVIQGKNHFQIEAPEYDQYVVEQAISLAERIAVEGAREGVGEY